VVRKATPPAAAPQPPVVRKATPTPRQPQPRLVRVTPTPRRVVADAPAAPTPQLRRVRKVTVGQYTDLPPNTVLRSKNGRRDGPVLVVDKSGKVVKMTEDGVRIYAGESGRTRVTGQTRIAPKRAYEKGASVRVPVPEGYEPAFKDGRHSRTRAHQTLDGRRKMLLIWSNTVPRKLIDQYTGEEVGAYFPELQYPYRSMKEQRAAMVSSRNEAPRAAPKTLRRVEPAGPPASHRYIQLGSFSSRARAEGAIRQLQGAGLPVAVNEYTTSGTHYWMVLAGPFRRQAQLTSALDHVRHRIGYRSASLRP
ncbi:MAG: SPOR domain-containing protein, partial [Rhodobacteraceae bacterium]